MKNKIIADLHKILFGTDYTSDPDNWELNTTLAKGLLHHHGVYFKDKHEVVGSCYWTWTNDVEAHFYDYVCPGIVPSLTMFENICENYFDFDLWDAVRRTKAAGDVFNEAKQAIDKCLKVNDFDKVLTVKKN